MLLIHDGRSFVPSAAGCYPMLMHMGIVCSPVIMTQNRCVAILPYEPMRGSSQPTP